MQATKVRIESDEGGPYRLRVQTDDDEVFVFDLALLGSSELANLAKTAGWAQEAASEMEDSRAPRIAAVDGLDAYPLGDLKRVEMERAAHGDRGI